MDPELREYLEGLRKEFLEHVSGEVTGLKAGQEALRGEMLARFERVEGRIAAEVHIVRKDMKVMEQRLTEKIEARKEDVDALGGNIVKLQKRDDNLEKRVKVLESKAGG